MYIKSSGKRTRKIKNTCSEVKRDLMKYFSKPIIIGNNLVGCIGHQNCIRNESIIIGGQNMRKLKSFALTNEYKSCVYATKVLKSHTNNNF